MTIPTLLDKEKAMAALVCIKEVSPAGLKVSIRLLHHFNCKTERCDPGIGTIARAIGLCERSVYRAIKELEELRLFRVDHRRGRRNTNRYHPDFKRIMSYKATTRSGFGHKRPNPDENLTALTTNPDKGVAQNPTSTTGEHMKEHVKELRAEQFCEGLSRGDTHLNHYAQQRQPSRQRSDPMKIDWAGWIRWLGSDRIYGAIDRVKSETNLSEKEAWLIVDQALRKSRATWTSNQRIDKVLSEALSEAISRVSKPRG